MSSDPNTAPARSPSAGLGDGLLGVLVFSATLPATRLALEAFDPLALTAARAALAGLAAGLYLLAARRPFPALGDLPTLGLVATMLVAGFPGLMALATVTLEASHGAVVMGVLPLATAVAAVAFAGERPSPAFWVASVAGAALVVAFVMLRGGSATIAAADAVLLAAVAAAATGYAVSGRLSRRMDGLDVIAWACVLALPFAGAALIATCPALLSAMAAPRHWASLVYVGVMAQFLGFLWWNRGLAAGGVAKVGQIQLLQTFFTLAIAAVLLGETITIDMLAFAAAVAVCVVLARRARVS
jgi:drug/metabolite transporter (DMT)-like permease